jgi:hypothetical protein
MIAVIGELLTRQVAPRYFVDSEDNVYILGLDDPARSVVRPDPYLVEATATGALVHSHGRIATPVVLDMPATLEVRIPSLMVIDTADRSVVTTIEVLSPVNKVQGSSGRDDFVRKREHVLRSHTHWLEIDLLRGGTRPPGIPARGAYDAVLHRADAPDQLEVWFMSLREPLPIVAVPLRSPYEDVSLSLQDVVHTVYERYRYDAAIDYGEPPPPPPLSEADGTWANECIAVGRQ